ncbi:MAG: transporter substrate-binding domain-containing protein [Coriobacteriia bacterium]
MTHLKKWLSLVLVVALALAALGLSACAKTDEGTETTTEETGEEMAAGTYTIEYDGETYEVKLIEEGKFIVGSDTSYPPFESIDENGEVVGFDVDLVAAIADEVGVDYEFLTYNFDALIMGVQAGTDFDFIASAMTITDERDEEIDFSDPYFDAGQILAVRQDSEYTSLEDLAGQKIGVQSGTTGEEYVNENLPEGATVVPFENILQAFQALQNGDVEGVVNDLPVTQAIVADPARELKTVGEVMSAEQYGFGVSEDNPGLTALLSAALANVRESGQYDEIMAKWFSAE